MSLPEKLSTIEFRSGPAPAHDAELFVDGKKVNKVTHIKIEAGMNDAVRVEFDQLVGIVTTKSIAKIAEAYPDRAFGVGLNIPTDDGEDSGWHVWEGRGATVRAAVEAALSAYENGDPPRK